MQKKFCPLFFHYFKIVCIFLTLVAVSHFSQAASLYSTKKLPTQPVITNPTPSSLASDDNTTENTLLLKSVRTIDLNNFLSKKPLLQVQKKRNRTVVQKQVDQKNQIALEIFNQQFLDQYGDSAFVYHSLNSYAQSKQLFIEIESNLESHIQNLLLAFNLEHILLLDSIHLQQDNSSSDLKQQRYLNQQGNLIALSQSDVLANEQNSALTKYNSIFSIIHLIVNINNFIIIAIGFVTLSLIKLIYNFLGFKKFQR